MSWIGPAAKNALKYGPHTKQAWTHVGKPATELAQRALENQRARRCAITHAETLDDGSILQAFDQEAQGKIFIVFSGDQAVAAYPKPSRPLEDVLKGADLSRRRTTEEIREQRRRHRARERTRQIAQRRRLKPEKEVSPDDSSAPQ